MLALDDPMSVQGVSLFRDHAMPHRFYYLPGPPRLASVDGRRRLKLVRYRGARSGGLLQLEVDLAWPEDTLRAVSATLQAQAGSAVELLPAIFDEGTARVTALGVAASAAPPTTPASASAPAPAPVLVERVIGSTTPSLLGRQGAIFSLALDADATQLVHAALGGSDLPLLVCYELHFVGLRPARGLRARVHYQMAFDYLRTRLAGSTLCFRIDLDREVEALWRQGHIEVEDVDYQGADPETLARRRAEVLTTLRELIETLFFRPTSSPYALGPAGWMQSADLYAAWQRGGGSQTALLLRGLEQQEQQVLTFDLCEATVARVCIAPQVSLRCSGTLSLADVVTDVTVAENGGIPIEVRASCPSDADWHGVSQVVIDVRSGTDVHTMVLSADARDQSVLLPDPNGAAIEHRIRALLLDQTPCAVTPPGSSQAQPPWLPLSCLHIPIQPSRLSGLRPLDLSLGYIDATAVRAAQVKLQWADQVQDCLLTPNQPAARLQLCKGIPARLLVDLFLLDGNKLQLEQSIAPTQTSAVINQPAYVFQLVTVRCHDPLSRYQSIVVELQSDAAGNSPRVVQVSQRCPEAQWSQRVGTGRAASYRYQVRRIGKDARVTQEDWKVSRSALLVVGDVDVRVEAIEGVLLGIAGQLAVNLRVTSLSPPIDVPATVERLLGPEESLFRVELPFARSAQRRYQITAEAFFDDRTLLAQLDEQTAEVVLVPFAAP